MAENTKIEWCDATFNPWLGCTHVSPGCKFCYAEEMMDKRYGRVEWGVGKPRVRTSAANWKKPLAWNRAAEKAGRRDRVFCASLADVFDEEAPCRWRIDLFNLIRDTPALDWLLLTKRPQNIRPMLHEAYMNAQDGDCGDVLDSWLAEAPPVNVWLGTSVENQQAADERIPHLLQVPAAVRFLSCEPLLGAVDLREWIGEPGERAREHRTRTGHDVSQNWTWTDETYNPILRGKFTYPRCVNCEALLTDDIHWCIAGGESGPNARPMHPHWPRSLRDQCNAAGVAFHFKQFGEYVEWTGEQSPSPSWRFPHPDNTPMVRVGKKAAGRLLDGREWNGLPEVAR